MDRDPLSLRNLPQRSAPRELWSAVEQRLDAPETRRRSRPFGFAAATAAAAAVALAVAVWLVPMEHDPSPGTDSGQALLADARQASMQLERKLADSQSNVLNADDAMELAWLESELRLTDELLSENPRDVALWIKRTDLLNRMTRRYEIHDWDAQVRLASY